MDVQIAAAGAVQDGHALTAQAELRAILRALGNFEFLRLLDRRYLEFAAQRGLRHVDGNGAVQIVFLALEKRVWLHLQKYIKIACRSAMRARLAFARQTEAVAIVHPGGYVHLQLPLRLPVALAAAFAARVADNLPRAAAGSAGAPDGKEALLVENLSAAMASRAGSGSAARFGARSFTALARLHARNLNLGIQAEHRVFKTDFQIVADIFPALR